MKTNTQLAGALGLILAVGVLGAMVARPVGQCSKAGSTLGETMGYAPQGGNKWDSRYFRHKCAGAEVVGVAEKKNE